jgi:hypothetical protein
LVQIKLQKYVLSIHTNHKNQANHSSDKKSKSGSIISARLFTFAP